MREIVEWLCPGCESEKVRFVESEFKKGWLCFHCGNIFDDGTMFICNYIRKKVKQNIAKKTYRRSKSKRANK